MRWAMGTYSRRFEWVLITKLDVDLECSAFVRSTGLSDEI